LKGNKGGEIRTEKELNIYHRKVCMDTKSISISGLGMGILAIVAGMLGLVLV